MNIYDELNTVKSIMDKMRAARHAPKPEAPKPMSLKEEILQWYENLPSDEKQVGWHMDFLRKRFGAPSQIGPILTEIGFIDKRDWKRGRPYRRYWFGPDTKVNREEL